MIVNTCGSFFGSKIEDLLFHSNTRFYLTGSRFFGNSNPNSDWDFFTEYKMSTARMLEKLGFAFHGETYLSLGEPEKINHDHGKLLDPSICQVYERDAVHVQLIRPELMHIKIKAQEVLHRMLGFKNLTKEERRVAWTAVQYGLMESWRAVNAPLNTRVQELCGL